MAEFVWEARGKTGELRKGVMEAETENTVQTRLRQQQLNPTKVKKKIKALSLKFGSGVNAKDLVTFTRLFATMIDAGLPIVQCLDILQGQTDNPHFQVVLKDVKNSVEQGSTFSDSLRKHPKVFDSLYSNLVQAGEVGGILDTILNRLAVYHRLPTAGLYSCSSAWPCSATTTSTIALSRSPTCSASSLVSPTPISDCFRASTASRI